MRSNVHILEYFIVGLAVCGFFKSRGWKVWGGAAVGCGIGVIDERIKVLLPGRELEIYDLIRNCLGVLITVVAKRLKKREV